VQNVLTVQIHPTLSLNVYKNKETSEVNIMIQLLVHGRPIQA